MKKDFTTEIKEHIMAGFAIVLVEAVEESSAFEEMDLFNLKTSIPQSDGTQKKQNIKVFSYSAGPNGMLEYQNSITCKPANKEDLADAMNHLLGQDSSVLVAFDIEKELEESWRLVRFIKESPPQLRMRQSTLIIVTADAVAFKEKFQTLSSECAVIRYKLPSKEVLAKLVDDFTSDNPSNPIKDKEKAVKYLLGLTKQQASDALAKSAIAQKEGDPIEASDLLEFKKQTLSAGSVCEIIEHSRGFSSLVGMENLKTWMVQRFRAAKTEAARKLNTKPPKGLLFIGPPGTGKTEMAKAIAHEFNLPLIKFNLAAAFGSLLGETEKNIRQFFAVVNAIGDCIVWLDEIERLLGQGDIDGGAANRVIGLFLTWLVEKPEGVFIVATGNDVSKIPAQILRKGRFDEIFAIGMPTVELLARIAEHYAKPYSKDVDFADLASKLDGFVPSEVEAIIEEAKYLAIEAERDFIKQADIETVIGLTTPISISMKGQITKMEEWAKANARPANKEKEDTNTNIVIDQNRRSIKR